MAYVSAHQLLVSPIQFIVAKWAELPMVHGQATNHVDCLCGWRATGTQTIEVHLISVSPEIRAKYYEQRYRGEMTELETLRHELNRAKSELEEAGKIIAGNGQLPATGGLFRQAAERIQRTLNTPWCIYCKLPINSGQTFFSLGDSRQQVIHEDCQKKKERDGKKEEME